MAAIIIGTLLLLALTIAISSRLRRGVQPSSPTPVEAVPVTAATVANGDIRIIVTGLGTVTPLTTVTVQTQISGRVTEVGFTEGQLVHKGDFLAQVDARPYELLKAQYEGQLAHDKALLAEAQTDLARYQRLAEQNSIAKQQYEDQVYLVQQYQGTVKVDQAQLDQQALNIEYCHIVAPITGYIGLRSVDPGNYVQTVNNTGIAVITQQQPITVVFPIPEDDLPQIRAEMRSGNSLTVTAYDRANVTKLAEGRLTAVDSQIDTSTGTVRLRAQFDNSDERLFPNQFVNAQVLVRTLRNVIAVPNAAIQSSATRPYVYLINDNGTVSVRPVKLGPVDGDRSEVESGLSPGDRVVVEGADRLRDGTLVTTPAEAGSQPGALKEN